jgi:hypothetical protein
MEAREPEGRLPSLPLGCAAQLRKGWSEAVPEKVRESQIVRAIMDYLAVCQVLSFRMNTGAIGGTHKGKQRFVRFGVVGMADILAFRVQHRGVGDQGNWCSFTEITPLWIECKTATGKQSEHQKSFQKQVEEHGHKYIVARGIEDVENLF